MYIYIATMYIYIATKNMVKISRFWKPIVFNISRLSKNSVFATIYIYIATM